MEINNILHKVLEGSFSPKEGAKLLKKMGYKTLKGIKSEPPKERKVTNDKEVIVNTSGASLSKLMKEIENQVAEILSVNSKDIDRSTNFINLGLDSVMIMELTETLAEQLNVDLYPTLLFEEQNITEVATYLLKHHKKAVLSFLDITEEEINTVKVHEQKENFYKSQVVTALTSKPIEKIRVEQKESSNDDDIAIIGMGAILPEAKTIDEFWENLLAEKNSINNPPKDREQSLKFGWNKEQLPKGGFIEDIYDFDPMFFKLSPREVEYMDPQQRLLLKVVWNAFEDAAYDISRIDTQKIGLFIGVSTSDFLELMLAQNTPINAHSATGSIHSILANRISYLFNFGGPSEVVDTACSSALVALNRAVMSLEQGECEIAVVAGVNALLTGRLFNSFGQAGMLSKDEQCKTFDEDADGYVRGEGAGCIILKKKTKAITDRDPIRAYIKNVVVNHGGRSNSLTAPNVKSQIALYKRAYQEKGINPLALGYIEAQGTGTKLGDSIEVTAATKAITEMSADQVTGQEQIFIGSAKTNIGHLEAASGIVSIIKAALILENEIIPKTLNIKQKSSYLRLEENPIKIAEQQYKWNAVFEGNHKKNLIGVSAFGFGGTNAHAVLKKQLEKAVSTVTTEREVIVLSSREQQSLRQNAALLKQYIVKNQENIVLQDIAYTLQIGRKQMETRTAFVVSSIDELIAELECIASESNKAQQLYTILDFPEETLFDNEAPCINFCLDLIQKGKLELLLQKWIIGEPVPFSKIFTSGNRKRIHLPGYYFKNQSYYLPGTENTPAIKTFEETSKIAKTVKKDVITIIECIDKVKTIIAETVKVPVEEIGAQVTFTNLGLDSVLGVECIEKINEAFAIDLAPIIIYDYVNIHQLSKYILKEELKVEEVETTAQKNDDIIQEYSEDELLEGIAVVGMSGKFPGADTLDEFWENLTSATNTVTPVPLHRWDSKKHYDDTLATPNSTNSKWGGFIKDIDKFDPSFFKISPREAIAMDPQQRLFLMEAWKALEDAGYSNKYLNGKQAGVFVGVSDNVSGYKRILKEEGVHTSASTFIGNSSSILSARIAYHLNLKGPALAIDTACSSSLVALHLAMESIQNGTSDIALAGGVCTLTTEDFHVDSGQARMLSPTGLCKAFDTNADGFVPAEGVGVIVLKKLKEALKDGDRVHAVLIASDMNQDGTGNGITAPSSLSQQQLIEKVLDKAQCTADAIGYVEAHGSGTSLGDPIEINALTNAYRKHTETTNYCHIGSVKSNIGHTLTAAGIAGILKTILALKHKTIPPTLHVNEKNKHIQWEQTPFIVNTQNVVWNSSRERIGAVSSFGFSGTNVHVLIKEAPIVTNKLQKGIHKTHILCFAAKTKKALKSYIKTITKYIDENAIKIEDLAYMLSTRSSHFGYRYSLIATTIDEVKQQLNKFKPDSNNEDRISFTVLSEVLFTEEQHEVYTNAITNLEDNRKESLETLTGLYHQGYSIDWEKVYSAQEYNFLETPKPQMDLKSYWPFEIKKETEKEIITKSLKPESYFAIQPLAKEENTFTISFFDKNDVIVDHKVKGKSVLPGVSYIEILLQTIKFKGFDKNSITVRNMEWMRPLMFEDRQQELFLKFKGSTFIFYQVHEQRTIVYASGSIEKTDLNTSIRIKKYAIESIKKQSTTIHEDNIYTELKAVGLTYGQAFNGVEKIWQNGQWALSKIDKKIENSTINNYTINPAILDSALHGVFKLLNSDTLEVNETPIPIKINKIQLFDTIDTSIYSYIKEIQHEGEKNYRFNLILLKENGQVLAVIEGLELQASKLANFYN